MSYRTVQLPFFLSSENAKRNVKGNQFTVAIDPPVQIPRTVENTRVSVLEASVVHSMKNVDASNKTVILKVNNTVHPVELKEGLYANVDELANGLVAAFIGENFIGQQPMKNVGVAGIRKQFLDIIVNPVTNRVSFVAPHADWVVEVADDRMDGFNKLLGFDGSETAVTSNTGVKTYAASGIARLDKVNSLAIACPGLATGVHINGNAGASVLCRFPVDVQRNEVIQYLPINPVKSSYPLQGTTITQLNIELLDQNGGAVDTQGESFSLTLLIEYDMRI